MFKTMMFFTALIMVSLLNSCDVQSDVSEEFPNETKENNMNKSFFNLFEIDFGSSVNVKEFRTEGNYYSSWVIDDMSGRVSIEIVQSENDSTVYPSISSYDNVLSLNVSEKDNFFIENISIDETDYRLVERSFSSGLYFIELYGESVCSNNSQILITGVDLSEKDKEWLKNSFQSIKLNCNN